MKRESFKNTGFSFIETVIVTGILILILLALLVLYSNYSKVYTYQQALIRTADSARVAMNELQKDALQTNQILANHTFSGTTYNSGQHTLVLEIPSIDGSGNIISGKSDYVVFYTTGTNLYERTQADAASSRPSSLRQLSDTIATLSFVYSDADLSKATKIDTDLQMQTAAGRETAAYHLHQEIYLRNK